MIIVTNTNDSGAGSLRQAVIDAASGEEITFSVTGTITLTSGQILIDQDLTITGPGSGSLIISGNNTSRIFKLEPPGIITITGLTLQTGNDTDGGAIHSITVVTLSDIIIQSCVASGNGGGIYNSNTMSTTGALTVSGCAAGTNGGGIYNDGTLTIGGTTQVNANGASSDGGGIWNGGGGTISGYVGTLNSNTAGGTGGGLYNASTVTMDSTTIDDNTAIGIYTFFGTTTLTRCAVTNNSAEGMKDDNSTVTVINCTISTNGAEGIQLTGSAWNITHCTIVNNGGYGITNSGVVDCYDTIVVGNTDIDVYTVPEDFFSGGHNIFGVTDAITPDASDLTGYSFAMVVLGPLQNNGGTTMTHALLEGSPAINAGDNTNAPATDQRGDTRIVGGTIDIGAYESDVTETCLEVVGTVPAWAQVEGNCIVAKPGMFRGATKAEANARALAALEEYYAEALATDAIFCGVTPPICETVPAFATTQQTLQLTGPGESPNRPGSYTHPVTFEGTAGDVVSIWMDSETFDTYLFLEAPDTTVIASNNGTAYLYDTPTVSSAGITIALPQTGTYTIDCTSYDPAITGEFRITISSNYQDYAVWGVGTNNFTREMVYIQEPNRIVAVNQIGTGATSGIKIAVLDPCTMGTLHTQVEEFNPLGICFNSSNGLVYVTAQTGDLYTFDPVTYQFTLVASGVINDNQSGNGSGMAYDPVTNRIFIGVRVTTSPPSSTKGVRVMNGADNTEIALVDVGGDVGWVAYSDTGYIYVTVGTVIKKVNCSTLAVTSTGIACRNLSKLTSVNEVGLILSNTTSFSNYRYNIISTATDTVIDFKNASSQGHWSAAWNPNLSRMLVTGYQNPLDNGQGVAYYDPVTQSITGFILLPRLYDIVYCPETKSCFMLQGDEAGLYQIT